jgi:hypothetical protein
MSLDLVFLGMLLLLTGLVFFLQVWGLPRHSSGLHGSSIPVPLAQSLSDDSQFDHA